MMAFTTSCRVLSIVSPTIAPRESRSFQGGPLPMKCGSTITPLGPSGARSVITS